MTVLNDNLASWAKKKLSAERLRLKKLQKAMHEGELDENLGTSIAELSTYDNHPADIGTETFERSKDYALAGLLSRRLKTLEAALEAIDRGTYGTCENCGSPIPLERIYAAPETTLCLDCRAELHDSDSGVSERPARVGYDDEDAWQEVARFGTSSTPAELPETKPDEPTKS